MLLLATIAAYIIMCEGAQQPDGGMPACRSSPDLRPDGTDAIPQAKWETFQDLYKKLAKHPYRVVNTWLREQADKTEAYDALRSSPKVSRLLACIDANGFLCRSQCCAALLSIQAQSGL